MPQTAYYCSVASTQIGVGCTLPSIDPSGISATVAESVSHISATEWDALAGGNALLAHGWFRTLESCRTVPVPQRYIMLRGATGLLGAIAARIEESPAAAGNVDAILFGGLSRLARKLRLNLLPALVCGVPYCPGSGTLTGPDLTANDRLMVERRLVEAAETLADSNGYTLCFRCVPPRESPLAGFLAARGYLAASELPLNYLDLSSYASFLEYRRAIHRVHPATAKNIPTEINHAARHGLSIERLDAPSPYRDEIHQILNASYMRLNGMPFTYQPHFCDTLKANLGERAGIYVARLGGRIMGVNFRFKARDLAYFPIIGVDPAGRKSSTYFNLGYNHQIATGIAEGLRGIFFGRLLYDLKARRGCRQIPLELYIRVPNRIHRVALGGLLPLQTANLSRKISDNQC
jgi:predicted N-acyltransferase